MDFLVGIREVFQNFDASVLLGCATLLYLAIQLLRGKLKVNDTELKIPWLTDKFNSLAQEAKTWIILGLFGVFGILIGISEGEKITFFSIVDYLISGLVTGGLTIGVRTGAKQGISGLNKAINSFKENRKSKNENKS